MGVLHSQARALGSPCGSTTPTLTGPADAPVYDSFDADDQQLTAHDVANGYVDPSAARPPSLHLHHRTSTSSLSVDPSPAPPGEEHGTPVGLDTTDPTRGGTSAQSGGGGSRMQARTVTRSDGAAFGFLLQPTSPKGDPFGATSTPGSPDVSELVLHATTQRRLAAEQRDHPRRHSDEGVSGGPPLFHSVRGGVDVGAPAAPYSARGVASRRRTSMPVISGNVIAVCMAVLDMRMGRMHCDLIDVCMDVHHCMPEKYVCFYYILAILYLV